MASTKSTEILIILLITFPSLPSRQQSRAYGLWYAIHEDFYGPVSGIQRRNIHKALGLRVSLFHVVSRPMVLAFSVDYLGFLSEFKSKTFSPSICFLSSDKESTRLVSSPAFDYLRVSSLALSEVLE